jgi:hypothetical protein
MNAPVTSIKEDPKKVPKLINKEFPIESVTVVVCQRDKNGNVHEAIHTVDGTDVSIVDYQFNIKQKHVKAKTEDGTVIGFEPSGEETLKLVLSYIRAA